MSSVFDSLIQHTDNIKLVLEHRAFKSDETHPFEWENLIYVSGHIRRAHLDVVDVRDTKKLYMMHLCIFPKVWDSAPIFGFDLIAGPKKVTGAFLDFSPSGDPNHPLCEWFSKRTKGLNWNKPRNLPTWAKNIFSPSMVAAGNIVCKEELDSILSLSLDSLTYYLDNIYKCWTQETLEYKLSNYDYTKHQNFYCENQKQNPHTPRVMKSLGFSEDVVDKFIKECLFPEL